MTWSPDEVRGWAQAKNAEVVGGPAPNAGSDRTLDPVVAAAVDSLGIVVGQHRTADRRYRGAIAKGLKILKSAGYDLNPQSLHTHAIGHGWVSSNADILRDVAGRINQGRVIQGIKVAPLVDDVLQHWRDQAAGGSAQGS